MNYNINRIHATPITAQDHISKIPFPPSRQNLQNLQPQQNIFTAPPIRSTTTSVPIMQRHIQTEDRGGSQIIEAKPVIRNKMAEITKFVPSSVIVNRDQKTSFNRSKQFLFILITLST